MTVPPLLLGRDLSFYLIHSRSTSFLFFHILTIISFWLAKVPPPSHALLLFGLPCVSQDILTWKILGYGVRWGKLYYLELTEKGGSKLSQVNQTSSEDKARAIVWLWNRRVGHNSRLAILTSCNHICFKV